MMENEKERLADDLKPSVGDYTHAGVRAGLSTTPFLGGPLTEVFSMVIAPPLEKRRDAWMIEIFSRLKQLEERIDGFKIENLAENEVFISTLFYASQVAMRTHQEEKLAALRNAVINSAILHAPNENLQLMFLNLVDRYTPWHLKLLQFFKVSTQKFKNNPETDHNAISDIINENIVEAGDAIENTFSELKGKQSFYDQIIRNLMSDGVFETTSLSETKLTTLSMDDLILSDFGEQFLNFIMINKSNNEMRPFNDK